jgi:hypothetical protein
MIKFTLLLQLLVFSLNTNGQTTLQFDHKPSTCKYAGTYNYGGINRKGAAGSIIIYPETDTTVLFYIDLNKGAPSFNMGSLYGRVIVNGERGTFSTRLDNENKGCEWTLNFSKKSLNITTSFGYGDCGFGNAVYADGKFKKRSNKIIQHFENTEGEKVYFYKTKPEDYYEN